MGFCWYSVEFSGVGTHRVVEYSGTHRFVEFSGFRRTVFSNDSLGFSNSFHCLFEFAASLNWIFE